MLGVRLERYTEAELDAPRARFEWRVLGRRSGHTPRRAECVN